MVVGYQEVSGYDPFMIERVGNLYRGVPQTTSWNLLGVRWVVTPHRLAHPGLEHAYRGPDGHVYENTEALPRVVIPRRVETGLDPEAVVSRMAAHGFDPRELLLLEDGVAEAASGRAEIVDYRPERIEIDVELDRPGWVLLHEIAHPGWRAFDGAEELEIATGNYTFRAVHLPAGARRISLVYRPRSLAIAGAISCICWLSCLAFPMLRARRTSRRWSPAPRRIHAELPST